MPSTPENFWIRFPAGTMLTDHAGDAQAGAAHPPRHAGPVPAAEGTAMMSEQSTAQAMRG